MKKIVLAIALCASLPGLLVAQQRPGSLRGQVLDELGGAIVGATVTAIDSKGVEKTVVTNDGGSYTINGLAPGKYTVRAVNAGFAITETADVEVVAGKAQQFDITLKVAIEEQKVTIATDNRELSTEPENNAGAIVLKGEDIDALPDDPDDLAAALQALAGHRLVQTAVRSLLTVSPAAACRHALRFARSASTRIRFPLNTIALA
ncbi:MAG TPA: carboxypeptidase-like regulatory domain-containing protein [Pyrinomonadaceae bacterium]|nr:carboxypeptidase-like regulatory domain-containing protein [Pyrinomonadaceae bacterium]